MKKERSKCRAIDLFCGAGGLTSGLRKSGIDVAGGFDIDLTCRYAYEKNNPGSLFFSHSVSKINGDDLSRIWGNAEVRVLAGCAPCQPFSTYLQKKSPPQDRRYGLLGEFQRLISETLPDFVTMENVPSLLKQDVFADFVAQLEEKKYGVWFNVVNCNDFSVPQHRKRLVLLASRDPGAIPSLRKTGKRTTVREAISHLPPLSAGEIDLSDNLHRAPRLSPLNLRRIRNSVPGGSWKDWPEELKSECHKRETGNGYTPVYGRMEWEKPSPTLTTQCYNYGSGRYGHPSQDRAISIREAAVLQSFPENYQFEAPNAQTTTRDLARAIGNAVPVSLGKAVGRAILRKI